MRISVADPGIRGGDRIVLTSLTPSHFSACSKPGSGLKTPYVMVFFIFNGSE
jgi:hypothetical protein